MKVLFCKPIVYDVVGKANSQLRNIEKKVTLVAIKLLRVLVTFLRKISPFGGGTLKKFEAKIKKKQILLTSIANKNSIPAQKSFEDRISDWVNDSKITGDKKEAAKRILDCYKNSATTLKLKFLGLSNIPSEIGNLSKLEKLNLSGNKLKKLPPEIGNLSKLEKLDLSGNKLKKLPPEILNLSNLTELNFCVNFLKELPLEIVDLSSLTGLYLAGNKLKKLPPEIRNLTNLELLALFDNNLEEFPIELGQLRSLKSLVVSDNLNLSQLPLCLGNLVNLFYIGISKTKILDSDRDSILDSCKKLRKAQAIDTLPDKIKVWVSASKKGVDLSEIDQLESEQKGHLYEWLIRLERTKDFQKDQRALAEIVCEILKEMLENKEFKGLFFSQIEANNENCQDRASMALNEIYTSMLLHRMQKDKPLQDRLQVLVGCAKTLALRSAVSQVIDDHQKEQGYAEGEAVQIYLYCETHLRDKLGLVTAIKSMTYTDIGKRNWVDQDELIETVNETYLDFLVEIPVFEELLKKEEDYQKMESEQTDDLDNKINELCETPPETQNKESVEYLEWEREINVLNNQRNEKVKEIRKEWVREKLSSLQ